MTSTAPRSSLKPASNACRLAIRPGAFALLALLVTACAGGREEGARGDAKGKSMVLLPIDTAAITAVGAAAEDVVFGFADDGGPLSAPRVLAAQFQDRFRRSLDFRLARNRLPVVAAADSQAIPPAYALRIDSLRAYRDTVTELMPKAGMLTRYPLNLQGHWTFLEAAPGKAIAQGRFRSFVTFKLKAGSDEWVEALDQAARQVAKDLPIPR